MIPARDDDVETWITRWRDAYFAADEEWFALNDLLEDYGRHADTGTPLTEDIGLKPGWAPS